MYSAGKKPIYAFLLVIFIVSSCTFVSNTTAQLSATTILSSGSIVHEPVSQVTLSFEAYDLNMAQELRIRMNGQVVSSVPAANNSSGSGVWTSTFNFDITTYCNLAENYLHFDNPFPYGASRVRNVNVTSNGRQVLFNSPTAAIVGDPTAPKSAIYGPFSISQNPPPQPKLTAWYGIGEDYKLTMAYDPTKNPDFLTMDWPALLNDQRFSKWGFNVIRLSFHFPDLGTNQRFADHSDLDYDAFASVVRLLASFGYKVVATDHSWANFGSSKWMSAWTNFVEWLNQANNADIRDAIVCYELRNECEEWTYEQEPWWNGLSMPNRNSPPVGWNWGEMVTAAYANLTDRIRTIQPGALVAWADPSAYYQSRVRTEDMRDGVVYAWHVWTNDLEDKGHIEPILIANWATGPWMNKTKYPNSRNWIGEFGSYYQTANIEEGICTYEGQKYTFTNGPTSLMQWSMNSNVGFSMFYWQHWNKQDEYSDWLRTIGFIGLRK